MRLFLLLLCLPFAVTAYAEDRIIGDWVVSVDGGIYETYTGNESGSTLGLLCTETNCSFYLRAGITCESEGSYLALINSKNGASSQQLSCAPLTLNGRTEYVILIGDIESFATTVLNSSTIGIAIPMASGQFKVSRFSLRGATKALEAVVNLRKASTSAPSPSKKQGFRDTRL